MVHVVDDAKGSFHIERLAAGIDERCEGCSVWTVASLLHLSHHIHRTLNLQRASACVDQASEAHSIRSDPPPLHLLKHAKCSIKLPRFSAGINQCVVCVCVSLNPSILHHLEDLRSQAAILDVMKTSTTSNVHKAMRSTLLGGTMPTALLLATMSLVTAWVGFPFFTSLYRADIRELVRLQLTMHPPQMLAQFAALSHKHRPDKCMSLCLALCPPSTFC